MSEKKSAAKKPKAGKSAEKSTKESAEKSAPKANQAEAVSQSPSGQSSGLPMFYNSVELLNSEKHLNLKLTDVADYAFASSANSIVLTATEFPPAAKHYPIVFGPEGDSVTAFAVTGYANGENVFLDEENRWRADTYIPGYVRRYPFILAESADSQTLTLGVDMESGRFSEKEGAPIYENGKPGKIADQALSFCMKFRDELKNSTILYKQIEDAGILIERSADVTLPDSKKARITGFKIVDEQKFMELDDETFLALRKSGALTLIYCQLWSMRTWGNLLG